MRSGLSPGRGSFKRGSKKQALLSYYYYWFPVFSEAASNSEYVVRESLLLPLVIGCESRQPA
jgi:hypothetical protein